MSRFSSETRSISPFTFLWGLGRGPICLCLLYSYIICREKSDVSKFCTSLEDWKSMLWWFASKNLWLVLSIYVVTKMSKCRCVHGKIHYYSNILHCISNNLPHHLAGGPGQNIHYLQAITIRHLTVNSTHLPMIIRYVFKSFKPVITISQARNKAIKGCRCFWNG